MRAVCPVYQTDMVTAGPFDMRTTAPEQLKVYSNT